MTSSESPALTGGCLCGRVKFRVDGRFGPVALCHCGMCRKANGSAFASNASVGREHFTLLQGEENVTEYESSPGKLRCFCRTCGSPVYSYLRDDPGEVRVRLGTLDGDPGVRPAFHYAVDFMAPWYSITDDLPRIDTEKRRTLAATHFAIAPIAFVRGARQTLEDDAWGGTECTIELAEGLGADALIGLDAFSHVEVLYVFDRVPEGEIEPGARHPRGNEAWPRVGILAQRAKGRPNRIGSTIARVLRLKDRKLVVGELDAVEGTPVVDLKPVMREFLPRTEITQPAWATELMKDYWR